MSSIYLQVVEIDSNYTIDLQGLRKTYVCKDASTPADYTVSVLSTGILIGDIVCIEGKADLTSKVTITSTAKIDGSDNKTIGAGDNILLKWTGTTWITSAGTLRNCLLQDTTVNIPAGSSLATIQAIVDAQPRNLNGYTLTFRFADGTYDFGTDGCLYIRSFHTGAVFLEGNPSDGLTAHSTQAVRLKNTRTGDGGIGYFYNCTAQVAVRYIAFTTQLAGWNHGLLFIHGNVAIVEGCYFECNNGVNGSGLWSVHSDVRVTNCMFHSVDKCVGTDGGSVNMRDCNGDNNRYITGAYGGYVCLSTSLPSYTSALSNAGLGGQVWQS
jgi:hypothetical protein